MVVVMMLLQLYFADRERRTQTEFRGVKLDRFVYHSLSDGCALFSVHVPSPGDYFLEIFANKVCVCVCVSVCGCYLSTLSTQTAA